MCLHAPEKAHTTHYQLYLNSFLPQYHSTDIRNIIMLAMAEWYAQSNGDQQRLSRILDVAQDLKALSVLLNLTAFQFVIDLACLASTREYLKLDEWLSKKVQVHGVGILNRLTIFFGDQPRTYF